MVQQMQNIRKIIKTVMMNMSIKNIRKIPLEVEENNLILIK